MGSERQRQDRKQFLLEYEREQAELAERLERPLKLKKLAEEVSRNAGKLVEMNRMLALGREIQPFISDEVRHLRFESEEELEAFNRAEARAFRESTPEWEPTPGRIDTLLAYFTNRGIRAIDRQMYKSAFLLLKESGLFDEPESEARAPAPVDETVRPQEDDLEALPRLPLGHSVPVAWKRQGAEGGQMGIDLSDGLERFYTDREIERMDAETYRQTFRVPTPALTRVNFLKW